MTPSTTIGELSNDVAWLETPVLKVQAPFKFATFVVST
jgi:hypothetical protein